MVMPMAPQRADNLIAAFSQVTQGQSSSTNVLFRNGRMEAAGAVTSFFAGRTARTNTINTLQSALVAKYGENLANIAAPRLEGLLASGKPLKAHMVRDILAEITSAKDDLPRVNSLMVQQFLTGEAHMGHNFTDAMDSFLETQNWNQPQKDECRQLAHEYLSNNAPYANTELLSPSVLTEKVRSGELPCIKIFANTVNGVPDEHFRDVIERVPQNQAKDMAYIYSMFASPRTEMSNMARILETLPQMRAAQPDGPLTLATVWNAATGNAPLPAALNDQPNKLADALGVLLHDLAMQNTPPGKDMEVILSICSGLKLEKAIQLTQQPGPITMADLVSTPPLYALSSSSSLNDAEATLARDLPRMGGEDNGMHSIFRFSSPAGEHAVDVKDTSQMNPDDRNNYEHNLSSSMSRDILAQVTTLCGEGHDKQAQVVLYGMTQAGLSMVHNLSFVTGIPRSEHCAMNISVNREENGDIHMQYRRPEGTPFNYEADFLVRPDGSSSMTHMTMGPNPAPTV